MIAMTLDRIAAAVHATYEFPAGSGGTSPGCRRVRRITTDSRNLQPGDLFFAIRGERFDGHAFIPEAAAKGAVASVCNRDWFRASGGDGNGLSVPLLVVDDPIDALGRLAAHYRRHVMHVATVVVAVTGTNGKTTTKGMIDHILRGSFPGRAAPKSFNNHIGVPLTLLSAEAQDRYIIVEIGSNSPGEVAALAAMASPNAAVITSVDEAHLERLGGIDGVAKEKMSLLGHVRSDGLAVVNVDRPEIRPFLRGATRARILTVGMSADARLNVAGARGDINSTRFVLDGRFTVELPMPGLHHATNAAAAFAVARWFGVAPEEIIGRLKTFTPQAGRTRVLRIGRVTVVDDTYNANPASMAAAVETLRRCAGGRRVFVMGDMLELGKAGASFHRQAVASALDAGIEVLVAVGPAMAEATRSFDPSDCHARVTLCPDAAAASDVLMSLIEPGDMVWIKGSRAVGLDRVVDDLKAGLPRADLRTATRPAARQEPRMPGAAAREESAVGLR